MFNAVSYKEGVTHGQRVRRRPPLVHPPPRRGASGISNPFLRVSLSRFEGTGVEVSPPLPPFTRLSLGGSIPEVLFQLLPVRVPRGRFVVPLQPAPSHASPLPPSPADTPSPCQTPTHCWGGAHQLRAKAGLGAWVRSLLPAAISLPQAARLCLQRGGLRAGARWQGRGSWVSP